VDANGMLGRAVDWDAEAEAYQVHTFEGLSLDIPEENLELYEPPQPQDGGFDACWPYFEDTFFDFCSDINNVLLAKHWCVIQVSKSEESRHGALVKARRKEFEVPRQEFVSDYMGRKGHGKVSHIDPLHLMSPEDVEKLPQPSSELEQYDMDMSSLFAIMGPMTWDSMGFSSCGRTDAMAWLPFSSKREESTLAPEPLNDEDVDEDGLVEKHLHFLRRRRLCLLYTVDCEAEGGQLALYPRADLKQDPVQLPIQRGRMLVFRCDLMAFKYQPAGSHFTLLSWVLTDPPKLQVDDVMAIDKDKDELYGIKNGPAIPTGERAHVMSLACLTGGSVYSLADAQAMYMAGTDAHIYVPTTRFDTDLYFTNDGQSDHVPGFNSYHHHGGLMFNADVNSFDNEFFEISEHEASIMWPNQRKVLETGYETLYLGGWTKRTVQSQPILVYLGDCGSEWWGELHNRINAGEMAQCPGTSWYAAKSMFVTGSRLSYQLALRGPTWLCDTACSSGLTAFCTAMYSIKRPTERGTESPALDTHCQGCVAGGVNIIVDAGVYIGNSASHMLSLKGRCFTFDASGDGYARGEGCSLAYTVISNSDKDSEMQEGCAIGNKVNQDGRSASMTAPNGPAQQLCIRASLMEAGLEPHDITASECHGTGTALGDPIEVGSLRGVQEEDERTIPLFCTSSKSNIGHLEADAGITGVFKCVLMAKYSTGLPNVHTHHLNPHLDIGGWPAQFQSEIIDHEANSGLTGVSSFGISGTNAHTEIWALCRYGPYQAGREQMAMDKLHQFALTCPVTLGPIDHLTGEPVRPRGGRRYCADVLREELASYDVSSYAYEGGFRYRREALNDGEDLYNPEGVRVCICGSWSGWSQAEEMEQQADGSYLRTVILGDTRCETFYICINEHRDLRIYPAVNGAGPRIFIRGPDGQGAGKRWIIDGRDEEVPGGTVYQVRFWWGTERKKISWEEVSPKFAADALHYDHRYQVLGTWTSWQQEDMRRDPDDDVIWECSFRIGPSGQEEFQLCRDRDEQQLIYPAKPQGLRTSVPVRGPDELGAGKRWLIRGPVDEVVKIRAEIDDGKITVAVVSETKGEKVWESVEGWDRHEYWLALKDGPCRRMSMDPEIPGVFRARAVVGQNYDERFRGFCEFFNVIVDEDPNYAFYPEVGFASTGECIVRGPDRDCGGRPFTVKSWQAGAAFEAVLDLNATDRRRRVTWAWAAPPQLGFAGGGALADA